MGENLMKIYCFLILLGQALCNSTDKCAYKSQNLIYSGCSSEMNVRWWNHSPYIYRLDNEANIDGVMKTIVEKLIRDCCGECVQFNYLDPAENAVELTKSISLNDSLLSFPLYGTISMDEYQNKPYIPILESPGVVYITLLPPSTLGTQMLLRNIEKAWPVLVIALLMGIVAGIVMWVCDSYVNPEQFPSPFFIGAWEGFWWAMVTMTTVGYGDKAPRSSIARIIAFVWILIGLIINAIFSGFITTSSTAYILGENIELYGKNIVVINNTAGHNYGVRSNAEIQTVTNIEDFVRKIIEKPVGKGKGVAGGLLDSYVSGHYEEYLQKNKLVVGKVFDYQFAYGFVLSNEVDNSTFKQCILRKLSTQGNYITKLIQRRMKALPELELNVAKSPFDVESDAFQKSIIVCSALVLIFLICGVFVELLYLRPKRKEKEKVELKSAEEIDFQIDRSQEEVVMKQCQELEYAMVKEVLEFVNAFYRREEDFRIIVRQGNMKQSIDDILQKKKVHFVDTH